MRQPHWVVDLKTHMVGLVIGRVICQLYGQPGLGSADDPPCDSGYITHLLCVASVLGHLQMPSQPASAAT